MIDGEDGSRELSFLGYRDLFRGIAMGKVFNFNIG